MDCRGAPPWPSLNRGLTRFNFGLEGNHSSRFETDDPNVNAFTSDGLVVRLPDNKSQVTSVPWVDFYIGEWRGRAWTDNLAR